MKLVNITMLFTLITMGTAAKADPIATHGMVLFGDTTKYVSHMPMYHSPHDYQLVMQIQMLDSTHAPTLAPYQEAKKAGQKLFTIAPKPFDLTQIISGKLTEFSADLYSGHFEQSGINLGPIQIKIQKIILSKKLDPSEPETIIEHVIFGSHGEYFAVHSIKGKPSFDTVLKMTALEPDASVPFTIQEIPTVHNKVPPNKGDTLGDVGAPNAIVLDVIHLEKNDLAH